MQRDQSSGSKSLDDVAWDGMKQAAPYSPLPVQCKDKRVEIRFHFEYTRELNDERPACRPGGLGCVSGCGAVLAPRVIYAPDPEFSEVARKGKLQGIVVLDLIVGMGGLPTDVWLEMPREAD